MNRPYIAAGYTLVKPGPPIPAGGLTASACLAAVAPDSWAIDWVKMEPGERARHATGLGIAPEAVPEVVTWVTAEFGRRLKWPNVFTELEAAREFRRRFIPGGGVYLIGLGLAADLVPAFLSLSAPPPQQPGYAPIGPVGVYDVLNTGRTLETGGELRGFDVLGYDEAGRFCSFRCNGLEADFQKELGVQFNRWGLLDEPTVAQRCADYAGRPETATCTRWWHPWALFEFAC
jgi:hypothetical protein